jgi:DNA invertase Pin-like site-specific DNA recombinase
METERSQSCVAYYRVSTQKQGRSGLGLEAQQSAVRGHLDKTNRKLVAEHVEIESGKNPDRPKLAEALTLCRLTRSKLIVARLDRLARNVAFVSRLMEAGVDFEAVDFPAGEPVHGSHSGGRGRIRSAPDIRTHQGGACGS